MKCCDDEEFFWGSGGGVCCCWPDLELFDLFLPLPASLPFLLLLHLMATKEVGNGGNGGVLDGVWLEAAVAVIVPADVMELRFKASRYAA